MSRFTYISDVSSIPSEAMRALRSGPQIQVQYVSVFLCVCVCVFVCVCVLICVFNACVSCVFHACVSCVSARAHVYLST